MRFLLLLSVLCLSAAAVSAPPPPPGAAVPRFKVQEIDKSLSVGYAVLLVDINGDKKKDIVVVDTTRVIWFENPSWKLRTIIQGQTKPDNVCIDAHDIDGDGKIDLALGADWKPFNTKSGGTLQWLRQPKSLDEAWTLHAIDTEPTVHRIRFADVDGDGKPELVSGPLMGRNSTKEKNWMDAPLRVTAYKIPKDPVKERWTPEVLDAGLHVMHNFQPVDLDRDGKLEVLTASHDGVHVLRRGGDGQWSRLKLGEGNQAKPDSNRGASEIKLGRLKSGQPYIATIEPWHGNQVVVYTPPIDPKDSLWTRRVIDEELRWGHAVWCADLDGDGDEELIIGVRDRFSDKVGPGVNVYKATDAAATKWQKHVIDNGGVAVEDLAADDLDGDGKIDLVAVGRATKNVRIYWNGKE
jgi:hypothetical protein